MADLVLDTDASDPHIDAEAMNFFGGGVRSATPSPEHKGNTSESDIGKDAEDFFRNKKSNGEPQTNNTGAGSNGQGAASTAMAVGLPDKTKKSVELNKETIAQSIGKAIIAFLNNIGISPSSIEGQNFALTEGNAARETGGLNQARAFETVEKVSGIRPEVLQLALPEKNVFQSMNLSMANANQNTVKSQIVGTQQQAEIVASR